MDVVCRYCRESATYSPVRKMEDYGAKVYYCKPCSVEYVYYESSKGTEATTSIYTIINDKLYRWSMSPNEKYPDLSIARLWYVEFPGVPGFSPNKGMKVVASFGFHGKQSKIIPDITPENIKDKIKTYLVML